MNPKDNFDLFWRDKLKSKAPGVVMVVLGSIAAFCFFAVSFSFPVLSDFLISAGIALSLVLVLLGVCTIAVIVSYNKTIMEEYRKSIKPNDYNDTDVSTFSQADEIRKFKELLDAGIITQEEFDIKKKQLIGE